MSPENLLLESEMRAAGTRLPLREVLEGLPWNKHGLIAAIAQQHDSGEVLMLAWMNRSALEDYFGVSTPQASLDIQEYMRLAPGNAAYCKTAKAYIRTDAFKRVWA